MIIVNKNNSSMSKSFAELSNSDTNQPSSFTFEKALQDVAASGEKQTDPLLQTPAVQTTATSSWQNTLAVEQLIQDQLGMSQNPVSTSTAEVVTSHTKEFTLTSATGDSQPVSADRSTLSKTDAVLRNIIAWRQEQTDPLFQVRVGDIWASQGITDPFNDPQLIGQAQELLENAQLKQASASNYKAPWDGDWQTVLAQDRASNAQRIAVLLEGAANSNFVIGGGKA